MTSVLEKAGAAFLRAFGAAIVILATGILSAPTLHQAYLLGVAGAGAAIAAGLRAVQVFVPALSFTGIVSQPIAAWLDSFTRAFVGTFLVVITGWLAAPDLSTWRSVVTAALVGALSAGFRAVQGLLTKGEQPSTASGLHV